MWPSLNAPSFLRSGRLGPLASIGEMRMLSDFDVHSCNRKCAATEEIIEPGEIYYSVLQIHGAETVRTDYRADAWAGPPESCLAWWRSRLPTSPTEKAQLAPRDVLLNLLAELANLPSEVEFRYVLALVMLRRRVLRHQDSKIDEFGQEWLDLYCPHLDQQFSVKVAVPDSQQAEPLQQRLIHLLTSGQEENGGLENRPQNTNPARADQTKTNPNLSKPKIFPAGAKKLLLLLLLFCCTGATCSHSLRNPFASLGPAAPDVLPAGASLEQIIAAVNQNTERVLSYATNNASISVPGMPVIPMLRGNLVARRPQRFRLQASTALTGPEVDLGTNEELFWFWVKSNQPPALYYSRHNQFRGSAAQQVLPVEPAWFLSALGMVEFRSADFHEGPRPHGKGTVEIRSVINAATDTMTRSTVIDVKRAWVLQQHLYNSAGTLLASAIAHSHRYYPEYGVSLPQKIEIRLPPVQLALSINVGTVQLNSLAENPQMWSMPVLSGYPQIDLGTSQAAGTPIPAAGITSVAPMAPGATAPQAAPFLQTMPPGTSTQGFDLPMNPANSPNLLLPPRSVYQPNQGQPNQGQPGQGQTYQEPTKAALAAPLPHGQPSLPQTQQLPAAGIPVQ